MISYREWDDNQIAAIGDDEFNRLVQLEAKASSAENATRYYRCTGEHLDDKYDPSNYQWNAIGDGTLCLKCYEWRRYPPHQRHFGYAWFRTCEEDCKCAHHADEIWMDDIG